MTTRNVEIHYTTTAGRDGMVVVAMEDVNNDGVINETDIQSQQGQDAIRNKMTQELSATGADNRANLPGEIAVDRYRYDTDLTRDGNQWSNTTTGPNAGPNGFTRMPSIFRFRVNNQRIEQNQDSPYRARIGTGSEPDIAFHPNGEEGLQPSEAWEVMDTLFRRHGTTLQAYLENPSVISPQPDTDNMRQLRELLGQEVRMGSDGRPNLTVNDLVDSARRDPRAPASARTGAPAAIGPDGAAAAATAQDFTMTGDDAVLRFINDPSQSNMNAVDRKRASIGDLIAMLMAALQGGNMDVLTSLMDLIAMRGQTTVAIVAATTARMLIQNDQEARRLGEELNRVMGTSATGADATQRRQSDVTRIQQQLQQNSYARQSITNMIQTTTSTMESINNTSRTFREAWERAVHAGWLR